MKLTAAYCHNRIKIEGMENGETYCMLEINHEGPCQRAKIVRDRPSALPFREQYFADVKQNMK